MSAVDIVGELGHNVHEVLSAQNALAVLTTHTIDVLITDVGLPGMSGTDLAKQLRDRWPTIQIVFASGDDSARTSSGIVDAFQLSKPFTMDELEKS
ncbi:response regulator [Shinella oryzae]|uniref:response regulator n=1 Tax=Shinella oryzae TaxID=2871820 RepID=UPI001FF12D81|nr:response regulator [Shinella oryzae]